MDAQDRRVVIAEGSTLTIQVRKGKVLTECCAIENDDMVCTRFSNIKYGGARKCIVFKPNNGIHPICHNANPGVLTSNRIPVILLFCAST